MKILVVDDDPRIGRLLARLLEDRGYLPLVAHTAVAGARLFDQQWPELVILDIGVGQHGELDLLRTFKHQRSIPIIVLSSVDAEEARLRAFEAGADDYLSKPFSTRELLARIHAQLRSRGELATPAGNA